MNDGQESVDTATNRELYALLWALGCANPRYALLCKILMDGGFISLDLLPEEVSSSHNLERRVELTRISDQEAVLCDQRRSQGR